MDSNPAPYYSLEMNLEYEVVMRTKEYGILFYVRSVAEFNSVYPWDSFRKQVEDSIIIQTLQRRSSLNLRCSPERIDYPASCIKDLERRCAEISPHINTIPSI
ncbi:hypothetical protein Tco_0021030 [Tanacetum coccineum]